MSLNAATVLKGIRDIEQQRVFWVLIERRGFENYINRDMDMRFQNVSRAIKEQAEQDIILKGPKVGRNVTCRLNPNIGWPGTTSRLLERKIRPRRKALVW
ncbi:MAG: hypothetical protein ACYCYL_12445 [Acidithiobacillus sp.]